MRLLHTLVAVTLILLSTVAHGQQKGQFLPPDPFVMTTVSYVIDANIAAESSLVTATMQLKFRNSSSDTLAELWLQAGYIISPVESGRPDSMPLPDGRCFVDSVSMQGVTIGGDSLVFEGGLLRVRLPSRILPEKTGYLQIAFKTKPFAQKHGEYDALVMTLANWYPKVCRYVGGEWLPDTMASVHESRGERADYDLRVSIDTSLTLVFAAHLLNEKHHYGLLPGFVPGIVYEDFANRYGVGIDGRTYRPIFDQAKKPYLLRTTDVAGFPMTISRRLLRDRIKDDSLAIEVCYCPFDSAIWKGFAASSAFQLIKRLEMRQGAFAPRYLTIVAGDYTDLLSERLLILSRTIDNADLLYTAMAFQLAALWPFNKPADSTSPRDGRPDIVGELLKERFAADTDKMIDKYNTWCDEHEQLRER